MNPFGNSNDVTERERQLAELLEAVQVAQRSARALCVARPDDNQVKLLFGQLETVRLEVEQIRRESGAVPFEDVHPKWTGLLPWRMVPEY